MAKVIIELLARHPWLHADEKIVWTELDDAIHLREIEADAPFYGDDMSFETAARAKWNDGDLMAVGKPHHGDDLVLRLHEDDSIREMWLMVGKVATMGV
ncbi:hypothetical protein GCM10025859_29690 [Alicyclobacillus fastidiosus]|nr:hypothetical protein GCM10025859_29690 [Alicyclobacillus fastidiosus]